MVRRIYPADCCRQSFLLSPTISIVWRRLRIWSARMRPVSMRAAARITVFSSVVILFEPRAARFWLIFTIYGKPDFQAQATGWQARARRLLSECSEECAGAWTVALWVSLSKGPRR